MSGRWARTWQAWRPSGNLIASTQRLPHRHDIVFFERNGLRHGEITLPFGPKQVQVVELGWNANSTMLAVWVEELPADGAGQAPRSWLQLWTSSNYHWYLKQEISFDGPEHRDPIAAFAWDVENANRLLLALACGRLHEYTFYSGVDQTRGLTSANPAVVAVVDGLQLQLTPFRAAIVPPPMSRATAPLRGRADHATVVHVAFAPHLAPDAAVPVGYCSPTRIAAQMSDGAMNLLEYNNDEAVPRALGTLDVNGIIAKKYGGAQWGSTAVRHFTWMRGGSASPGAATNVWVCVVTGPDQNKDEVLEIVCSREVSGDTEGGDGGSAPPAGWEPSATYWTSVPGRVVSLQADDGASPRACAALCLHNGEVFKYTSVSHTGQADAQPYVVPWASRSGSNVLPEACHHMALVSFLSPQDDYDDDDDDEGGSDGGGMAVSDDSSGDDDAGGEGAAPVPSEPAKAPQPRQETHLVALTKHGQLFLSGEPIATNCNSFAVHDAYLVYATTNHTCRFLDTSLTFDDAIKSMEAEKRYPLDVALRSVERGSKIISVVPRHTKVVLQMPRGNLETVWPRALVLVAARSLLRSKQYRKAFVLMRKHRINLNLIYDLDPAQFEADVALIIDALGKDMHINVMLADMLDEDTTKSMYCEGSLVPLAKTAKVAGKRDRVSNLVRETVLAQMEGGEGKALEKVVVQTYIAQTTPQLSEALEYIRRVRDGSHEGSGQASKKRGNVFLPVGIFLDFVRRSGTTRAEGPHGAHVQGWVGIALGHVVAVM